MTAKTTARLVDRMGTSLRRSLGQIPTPTLMGPGPRERRPVVYVPPRWHHSHLERFYNLLDVFRRLGHPVYVVDPRSEPGPLGPKGAHRARSIADTPAANVILYLHNGCATYPIEAYRDPLIICDLVDESTVMAFDDESTRSTRVPPADRRLVEKADVVLAANDRLADEHWTLRPDLIVVPNGIFAGPIEREAPRPRDLPSDTTLIGSWAPIAPSFNLELVEMVARRRPDWTFAIVGAVDERLQSRVEAMSKYPNMFIPGARKPQMRPAYIQAMDVLAIWSVVNDETSFTVPLTMYEGLVAGKPVVSTPLPACKSEPAITTAAEPSAFIEAIEKALVANSPADVEARREAGRKADWFTRFRPVAALLDAARKMSII